MIPVETAELLGVPRAAHQKMTFLDLELVWKNQNLLTKGKFLDKGIAWSREDLLLLLCLVKRINKSSGRYTDKPRTQHSAGILTANVASLRRCLKITFL